MAELNQLFEHYQDSWAKNILNWSEARRVVTTQKVHVTVSIPSLLKERPCGYLNQDNIFGVPISKETHHEFVKQKSRNWKTTTILPPVGVFSFRPFTIYPVTCIHIFLHLWKRDLICIILYLSIWYSINTFPN